MPAPVVSRRRLAALGVAVVVAWLALSLAGQVGEASSVSVRADDLRLANAQLALDVAVIQDAAKQVRDSRFVAFQARAFGLGGPGEIPFSLAPDAPKLGAHAPGSAVIGRTADAAPRSNVEAWLVALFGPDR
jgi:cell division protein FtsB